MERDAPLVGIDFHQRRRTANLVHRSITSVAWSDDVNSAAATEVA
jgi:hypothetical protein